MNVIIVTPAGRERYLRVLLEHLKQQKKDFDEWHLWCNTDNVSDIEYFGKLASQYNWIKVVKTDKPINGNYSICNFFKDCIDENTIYIRLDDDIIWLEKSFIKKLAKFRANNPDPFLVYGNIINNGICDHIHQRIGIYKYTDYNFTYDCMCRSAWNNPDAAIYKHRLFLQNIDNTNQYIFSAWRLGYFERVSINCISWLGKTFKEFDGIVGDDEEQWLSVDKPKSINTPNTIFGGALCVHLAFHTQRDAVDKTDILNKYSQLIGLN